MNSPQLSQYKKVIAEAIELLQLDLTGLVILTETGTGPFLFTPVIAAMANAKKIIACINDSQYGKADDIENNCKEVLHNFNLKTDIIFVKNRKPTKEISEADIVTNSAHVRPLNAELLANAKAGCVIPLMYEKWEIRESDIEINYCNTKGIKVAGTWENFPAVNIFDYVAQLILKLCFEAGYEVSQNKIIVWSNDHFGEMAEKVFHANGAAGVSKVFSENDLYHNAKGADFILFCDYLDNRILLDTNGCIDLQKIKNINPAIGIVHLSGNINNEYVKQLGIEIYPDSKGSAVRMTRTLSHVGKRPAIYLNAAGLKVGECMIKNSKSDLVQPINY